MCFAALSPGRFDILPLKLSVQELWQLLVVSMSSAKPFPWCLRCITRMHLLSSEYPQPEQLWQDWAVPRRAEAQAATLAELGGVTVASVDEDALLLRLTTAEATADAGALTAGRSHFPGNPPGIAQNMVPAQNDRKRVLDAGMAACVLALSITGSEVSVQTVRVTQSS